MLRCPKCGNTDKLDIVARVCVRAIQTNPENIETDPAMAAVHDHEWDDASDIICRACDHQGTVMGFDQEEVAG
jgi:RecJ-like exonuclease